MQAFSSGQRLLEIARALASDPKLIILDEPAGSMNDPKTAVLIELIYAIRQRGVTVLLIEHDMGLVMKVCEKLLVLEYGSLIASGSPASDAMGQSGAVAVMTVGVLYLLFYTFRIKK